MGRDDAGLVGGLLYWATPFKPAQAIAMGLVSGGCGINDNTATNGSAPVDYAYEGVYYSYYQYGQITVE